MCAFSSFFFYVPGSGGLELICGREKVHQVEIPECKSMEMRRFLEFVKDNVVRERPDFFMQGDSIRPGVLVLVNDADWELEGGIDYVVQDKDCIVFISTLHGG